MDEEEKPKHAGYQIGADISELSVDELIEIIGELKKEIARLEHAANNKSDHLSAASALFKS